MLTFTDLSRYIVHTERWSSLGGKTKLTATYIKPITKINSNTFLCI